MEPRPPEHTERAGAPLFCPTCLFTPIAARGNRTCARIGPNDGPHFAWVARLLSPDFALRSWVYLHNYGIRERFLWCCCMGLGSLEVGRSNSLRPGPKTLEKCRKEMKVFFPGAKKARGNFVEF